jgi:hypothetical protein
LTGLFENADSSEEANNALRQSPIERSWAQIVVVKDGGRAPMYRLSIRAGYAVV